MNKSKIKDWGFSLFYNTDKGLNNCEPLQEIDLWRLFAIYNSPHLASKSKELAIATDEQKEKIKAQLRKSLKEWLVRKLPRCAS